ncbi:unnamed protein product [Hymenolepis diminuta]|uniref:Uncharacterized protein n=1 Tax=Hymenolepis diminuta TaxID=6216 RepID=A0A564YFB4_HYMDI|nr:unnamed protein product [Hymenolepis diminuta]
MKGVAKGLQSQKGDNSKPDPPQAYTDDLPSTIIISEMGFDTKQSHVYNREFSSQQLISLLPLKNFVCFPFTLINYSS